MLDRESRLHHPAGRHLRLSCFRLRDVHETTLGGKEHTGYAGCIFQSYTGYLGRVDDSGLEEIDELIEEVQNDK